MSITHLDWEPEQGHTPQLQCRESGEDAGRERKFRET